MFYTTVIVFYALKQEHSLFIIIRNSHIDINILSFRHYYTII